MLRAVLVDDEEPALILLSKMIEACTGVEVVGAYTDSHELLAEMEQLQPDVLFLDIEMPEVDGLELAERLLSMGGGFEIVFVTAYRQYAVEAFRVEALDYLLKPVEPELLQLSLERVIKRRRGGAGDGVQAEADMSRIVCFGGLEIYLQGKAEPLRFPTAKTEELFAYLLMHHSRKISMWTLCEQLWPDAKPEKSKVNLHTTIYRLKKTMRDNGVRVRISSSRGYYLLECEEPCDYLAFEQEAGMLTESGDPGAAEKLIRTVKRYKGTLFAHRDYPWCEAERERQVRLFGTLSKLLARRQIASGDINQAAQVLLSMVEHLPFDAEAHELLMRTYLQLQDFTSFHAHYEQLKRQFREELGVSPPEAVKHLAAQVQR
ncbi:hypothetical protein PA598K_04047 [Paenibacillus sp. 598K]|uniref:response regulator n=1 Tax=Paenibacillus sp. 598K TaxID=1117987 RepID=UPI000FF96208|nr:response regulator [Paenibacillus sp. 598K]GBF75628.1 hypothetical protein PA598K_04047 [Paenibacillus sp. 598K]